MKKNTQHIINKALLAQHSPFDNNLQEKLVDTYLAWINEYPTTNLFINKNQFFKYAKKRNEDVAASVIHLFISSLLGKNLLTQYYTSEDAKANMDWYQPESAFYQMADDITQLCEEISMRSNMLILSMDNVEKYQEFYKQLELLQHQLSRCMYCLQLAKKTEKQKEEPYNTNELKLPLSTQEKWNEKSIFVLLKLLKKEYKLEDVAAQFKQYQIEITAHELLKIIEENA